ncbi:hypothetical protein SAMN05421819_1211 [Bryocella elongata]|uniref:Streptogramin lyase n=1 Tax=Bryocella elongata TaxID=863522 RepID=A0A1H5UUW4_9BACT|nr:NHL repeat-containing protein [Bryocella elongata]SEF78796.1 hypothetical protein SAMN05421819_1211 [Bryocella elongata]
MLTHQEQAEHTWRHLASPDLWLRLAASVAMVVMLGCAGTISTTTSTVTTVTPQGAVLQGHVHAGQQPVAGATISLYAASTSGYKASSVSLLTQSVTTAADGGFSTTSYTCTSGQQLYLVASGGNPGQGVNSSLALMAVLGDCANLGTGASVTLNELTTLASVYALAQFMGSSTALGASATNAMGLAHAMELAQALVNTSSGAAPGTTLPATVTLPAAKLNTLADVLAACTATKGGIANDGSTCGTLFALAPSSSGSAPSNTIDAALNIAHQPAKNVARLDALAGSSTAFTPRLSSAPPDWTMALTCSGGGLNNPSAVAIDSTGSAWVANVAGAATKLSPLGEPAAGNGFADASLYESYGVAIDAQDNAWITNTESQSGVNGGDGSVTKLNSAGQVLSGTGYVDGGIYFPAAIAVTPAGKLWVADYGQASATLLNADGTSAAGTAAYVSASLPYPVAVAADAAGDAWFAAYGAAVHVTAGGSVTPYACCHDAPSGIALDPSGNVWITDYDASSLLEMNAGGTILQTLTGSGGLAFPQSLAIDGAGNVWVTNFQSRTLSGFSASSAGSLSTALATATGFGSDAGLAQPAGVAIDGEGNVWVTNSSAGSVSLFIGLAAPLRTPILGLPRTP